MEDVVDVVGSAENIKDEVPSARLSKRRLVDVKNPFSLYGEREFEERFRFTKDRVLLLLDKIRIDNDIFDVRGHSLDPLLQLTIALRFFAYGHIQMTDGDLIGVSRHTARRHIHRISKCIASKRGDFIAFHGNEDSVKEDFYAIAGFPRVIGCIDGTHIPIVCPSGSDAEVFRNSNGFFSLNVQMVCNMKREITNIVVRWPGSSHDSQIFDNSVLRDEFESDRYGDGLLLGDSGYGCRQYLMTPLLEPKTNQERNYNRAHIATRACIEDSFRLMKMRFRMLTSPMRMKLENSIPAIVAVACLHNFAIQTGQRYLSEDGIIDSQGDISNHDHDGVVISSSPSGEAVRREIIKNYF